MEKYKSSQLTDYLKNWDNIEILYNLIEKNIVEDPPPRLKEGNLFKPGCNAALDRLKSISRKGINWIASLESKEKEKTGIPVLKIGFNKIYGYYHRMPEPFQSEKIFKGTEIDKLYVCSDLQKKIFTETL